jgi:hypothetical protein
MRYAQKSRFTEQRMKRLPVESSTLISVGYDKASATLELEFRDGVYQYFGVPADVYNGLMNADSKGSYFNRVLRNAGYPCSKVS